ncbi:MAG: glycosyltransferase [Nonlabens sp.]
MKDNSALDYTVIVPVFNSRDTLEELITRIANVMQPYSYEILCIDDFSTDESWQVLKQLQEDFPALRMIKFTKNFGQAAASLCGIRNARANILVMIDDDLQYPPEEINALIENYNPENQYILFGIPRSSNIKKKNWTSKLVDRFLNSIVLKSNHKVKFSSFRILSKKRYDTDNYNEQTMKSVQVFFNMVSPELMDHIEVNYQPRVKGRSGYNLFKKTRIALELLLVTTYLPLYIFMTACLLSTGLLLILAGFHTLEMLYVSPNILLIAIIANILLLSMAAVLAFVYLRTIFMGYLGGDAYAIWEER